jgi:hypothetical protein
LNFQVIQIQEEFDIATICQRLFYDGQELDDNSATAASLRIMSNSVLMLREIREVEEILDSEDVAIRKREEGQGFGGTLLAGGSGNDATSSNLTTNSDSIQLEKPCSRCTFANPLNAVACELCDTIFV